MLEVRSSGSAAVRATPRLAASQNGLVHSLGTGTGRVTLLQSLMFLAS